MRLSDIEEADCPAYYRPYLQTLKDADLLELLERQMRNFPEFIGSIPESKWHYRYAPDKWSVAEVLLHILDTERVFQYRALRFGRKDFTPLPGFDQDAYVPESGASGRSRESVVKAYKAIRESSLLLFSSLPEANLSLRGEASGALISVGALGFIICGHQRHHRDILRARYLGR